MFYYSFAPLRPSPGTLTIVIHGFLPHPQPIQHPASHVSRLTSNVSRPTSRVPRLTSNIKQLSFATRFGSLTPRLPLDLARLPLVLTRFSTRFYLLLPRYLASNPGFGGEKTLTRFSIFRLSHRCYQDLATSLVTLQDRSGVIAGLSRPPDETDAAILGSRSYHPLGSRCPPFLITTIPAVFGPLPLYAVHWEVSHPPIPGHTESSFPCKLSHI
jgi:hypothetical protein